MSEPSTRGQVGNGFRDSLERIGEMVRKEFRQVLRDPRMRRMLFIAPIIQLVTFGYAVSTDIRNTKTFLVDHDRTQESRELVSAMTGPGYFRIIGTSDRSDDLVRSLDFGDAVVGLEIPPGFAQALHDGSGARLQLLVDGTNSNIATIAQGYALRIIQNFMLGHTSTPVTPAVDLEERAWYNPNLESRNYNVPAVVGTIMLLICLVLTSLAVVREREIGTLEQLMVSPLKPHELIAGKTIPFAIVGLFDLALITTIALFWFGIPFKGDFFLLLVASLFYLLSALGLGLLVSTISRTQQQAFLATFLIIMPTILLSGFMFPVSSMPKIFQWLTLANPMRHYLEIVRAIFLKGTGLGMLWHQFAALLAMGLFVLWFAGTRFRKIAS